MEASAAPTGRRPIEIGRVIREALAIYGANFGALVGVGVVIALLFGVVIGALNDGGDILLQFIATVLQFVAAALYTGFVVKLVMDVRDGRRDSSVRELISSTMPSLSELIVFSVLSGLAIAVGFVFLIIPGLFLFTIWSVGAPAIVVEGRSGFEAFSRSYELVKGNAWPVFGVIVCLILIQLALAIVLVVLGAAIGGLAGVIVVAVILLALYMPVQALVQSVLFFDLGGGAPPPAQSDTQVVVEY